MSNELVKSWLKPAIISLLKPGPLKKAVLLQVVAVCESPPSFFLADKCHSIYAPISPTFVQKFLR